MEERGAGKRKQAQVEEDEHAAFIRDVEEAGNHLDDSGTPDILVTPGKVVDGGNRSSLLTTDGACVSSHVFQWHLSAVWTSTRSANM